MSEQIEVLSNRDKVRERINVFHDSSSLTLSLLLRTSICSDITSLLYFLY